MRPLSRLFDVPDHVRDSDITRERMQADIADFLFRLTEMTLICGAVVYIERKLGAVPVASYLLAGFVAIYARSQATAGMLTLMKAHGLAPARQRLVYWTIQALALLLYAGILIVTNTVVPLIAKVQALGGSQ